jgi:hypothetical protein
MTVKLPMELWLSEVPVCAGQSITVCLHTNANDRVPLHQVLVELRVLPDGTPEVRLAPEDIDAGIVHTRTPTETRLTAPR